MSSISKTKKEGIKETTAISISGMLGEAGPVLVEGVELVWGICTSNLWLTFGLGVSLVALGFRFFRKAKRAAH